VAAPKRTNADICCAPGLLAVNDALTVAITAVRQASTPICLVPA
jgi:hypothetical protein